MAEHSDFLHHPVSAEAFGYIRQHAGSQWGNELNASTVMKNESKHSPNGAAGELVLLASDVGQGLRYVSAKDWNCDFIAPNSKKVDVKSRGGFCPPDRFYDVRVPEDAFGRQNCDAYVFVINQWNTTALTDSYLVGWLLKETLGDIAMFKRAGQVEDNGFVWEANHLATFAYRLNPMSTFREFCGAP